jgi:hypothetical protein
MTQEISFAWMKSHIDDSNKGASKNRNLYPIQEQATQMEIWEYVSCSCAPTCTCKRRCEKHWKLRSGVTAEEFRFAFLRTFVDRCEHLSLLKALERRETEYGIARYKEAFAVMRYIDENWEMLSRTAASYNKTLFCDGWDNVDFCKDWQKLEVKKGIYPAKMFCLLLPDTCVPFDSRSLVKILLFFNIPASTDYYSLLLGLREKFLPLLENSGDGMTVLRTLDRPGDFLRFNSRYVSFPRPDFDYGTGYVPEERQISFVLDKCFYNPKGNAE